MLGLLLLTGCHREKISTDEPSAIQVKDGRVVIADGSPQMAALNVQPAEPCQAAEMRLNGRLMWDDDVTVRVFTPFAGRVTKITVEAGQTIARDQALALVASPDYGQAQADARKAATDFVQAERTLHRVRELFEHGAAPQKDWQSAEADFTRAQSEKQRTEARLTLYGGTANATDPLYALKSPLAGVVVEKNLNPGQEVRPDQMLANTPQLCAPLFVVTDPARLWVQIDATEADLPNLKPGQPFTLRTGALAGREFKGRIELVSDSIDPASRTVKVRGSVDNSSRLLKAEMFVGVRISAPADDSTSLHVPAKAVFLKGEKHYIFVEENRGQYFRREIKAGPEHEGKIRVLDGLRPGQRVVTEGSLLLEQLLQSEGT